MVRTALTLLQRANETGGLKLTATGNLSRGVVAEMVEAVDWPGLDRDELFALNKVINEPDFPPCAFCSRTASSDETGPNTSRKTCADPHG